MGWRELLYCAFPESFSWMGREIYDDDMADLHEYAVFLRGRFDIIQRTQQVKELGFVMENLMDTYDWDSRGAEEFLEWLNPFNDYRGSSSRALEIAGELAEAFIENRTVEEEAVTRLLALTERLPRPSDGRLACFETLDTLQQLAVRRWLQEFAARYWARLGWIAQLELAMARLYWEHASEEQPSSIEALCAEHRRHQSRLETPSPWARLDQIWKSRQEEQPSCYGWYPPEDYGSFINELAPSADLSLQARREFTRSLRPSALLHAHDWESLYGWVDSDASLPDCLHTHRGLQIHSPRLRSIIEQLGLPDRVRYTPVHLMAQPNQREVAVYYAACYQVRLSCMSRNRTIGIWNKDFTEVLDLHRPALLGSRMAGEELFVVAEQEALVVVSRRVRDTIVAADVRGCEFKPILVVDE